MTAKHHIELRKGGLSGSMKNRSVYYVEGKPYYLKQIQERMDITSPRTIERVRRKMKELKAPFTWEKIQEIVDHYKKMEE